MISNAWFFFQDVDTTDGHFCNSKWNIYSLYLNLQMTAWHSLWLFVCGVITSVTIHFLLKSIQPSLQEYAKENLTLAIGILSAPENFQYRDAIRKSWKTKTGNNIKAWFIIGNQDCQIHPDNRIDQYGCDESRVQKENLLRLQNNLLTIDRKSVV